MKIWLAVDESGDGYFHTKYPHKETIDGIGYWETDGDDSEPYWVRHSTVELIAGKTMTWEDEPIEVQVFR